MNKRKQQSRFKSGAVSLFIVIFSAMLLTVVTVSFLRVMIQDQIQASNTDLSQSALDSAQAGIQDAELAIIRYMTTCADSSTDCATIQGQISSWANCNGIFNGGGTIPALKNTSGGNVQLETSSDGSATLAQDYTCVTVALNTDSVVEPISANTSQLIPLSGTGDFNSVEIKWYTQDDMGSPTNKTVSVTAPVNPASLLTQANWKITEPSLLRVQLIQYGASGFKLSDFDSTNPAQSDTNTLFLYPSCAPSGARGTCAPGGAARVADPFTTDARIKATATPLNVNCVATLTGGGYACDEILSLPTPIGGGSRTAYLQIEPLYNAAHVQVNLLNGTTAVQFNGVQPIIDSTGQANDLFRRVQAHVDLENPFPYPQAAVAITGNLCKNFAVTNQAADYTLLSPACAP